MVSVQPFGYIVVSCGYMPAICGCALTLGVLGPFGFRCPAAHSKTSLSMYSLHRVVMYRQGSPATRMLASVDLDTPSNFSSSASLKTFLQVKPSARVLSSGIFFFLLSDSLSP